MIWQLRKIISGGQTGADRAALDAARERGIPTGGWIPRGRRAEDGVVPARYRGLVETDADDYAARTERNVRDSDATVLFVHGKPTGGSALTARLARATGRPLLVIDFQREPPPVAAKHLASWIERRRPRTLNCAGPRASQDPGIADKVRHCLLAALGPWHEDHDRMH